MGVLPALPEAPALPLPDRPAESATPEPADARVLGAVAEGLRREASAAVGLDSCEGTRSTAGLDVTALRRHSA